MKRIDEVERLKIGKRYLVPCVKTLRQIQGYCTGEYVPVNGDWHDDPELGADFIHLHYDWRFIPKNRFDNISRAAAINLFWMGRADAIFLVNQQIEWRPLKCYRLTVEEPVNLTTNRSAWSRTNPDIHDRWQNFEQRYAETRLPSCRICPHRGFDLRHIPPDEDGNILCPGHWLKWNAQTGELVRRWDE